MDDCEPSPQKNKNKLSKKEPPEIVASELESENRIEAYRFENDNSSVLYFNPEKIKNLDISKL